jgi:hypothetical protein
MMGMKHRDVLIAPHLFYPLLGFNLPYDTFFQSTFAFLAEAFVWVR